MNTTKSVRGSVKQLALLCTLLMAGCCEDKTIAEVSSGKFMAIHAIGNCGATEPFDNLVILRRTTPRLGLQFLGRESEVVFDIEDDKAKIELIWETPTQLVVKCSQCSASIAKQLHVWKDVRISYEITK